MKKLITLLALLLTGLITGCNTMEGIGKDVQIGGEKVQDTARDARERM